MKKMLLLPLLLFTLFGCMDIFTTSAFASFATDVSDMTDDELIAYLESVSLSDLSDEDLETAETVLSENRIELSEDDLEDELLVAEYVEQTTQLLEINMAQADVEGLISEVFSTEEGEEDTDIFESILDDEDRLADIEEASGYAVDAYLVDPESLSSTELVVGSVGLVSDILQDEDSADALENVADFETATLVAAGFTTDEIDNIQTANEMIELAESNAGEDSPLASLFEGLPF